VDKTALEIWKDRADLWALIFAFVVGVGVAGEFLSHFAYRYFSRKLEPILVEESRLADERIAGANVRAEEAKRDAAVAKLELVRVERRLEPRTLTAQERVANKIVSWKVRQIAIVDARSEDAEAKDFLNQISRILAEADWHPVVIKDPTVARGLTGLLVIVNEKPGNRVSETTLAARSLVEALKDEGIFTQGPLSTPRQWPAPIHILIGAKPDWPKQ
jgi:hypothetical protein